MPTPMRPSEFHRSGVDDWRVVGDGACAHFRTGSFLEGAEFVSAIASMVEPHQAPSADVRTGGVTLRLVTISDDHWGLTDEHVELARRISDLARERGHTPDPGAVQTVQVTVAAEDPSEIIPFWKAVLGYAEVGDEDLLDRHGRGAPFWFQELGKPVKKRNRIHVDVFVPPEEGPARVEAALAAGGQLRNDSDAPAGWTLADPAGNVVDIATQEGRD